MTGRATTRRKQPRQRTFKREAVLTKRQVAEALQVSVRTVERMDLPVLFIGTTGTRLPRYLWGQVLDVLAERAA